MIGYIDKLITNNRLKILIGQPYTLLHPDATPPSTPTSRGVILGMDFLNQHGAVIDLRSTENAILPNRKIRQQALHVIQEQVSVPPFFVPTEERTELDGVMAGHQHMLLNRQICAANGIAELRHGKVKVMLTIFSHEYRHLNIAATVAYMNEFVNASDTVALFDATEPSSTNRDPQRAFDVDSSLTKHKHEELKALLLQQKDCFPSSSRIRQTPGVMGWKL